ncbi:hypothetical protein [Chromobacterium violaceum]|uniref:Phage tail tape measure protein n=2 Tax=Chromobacterium violaceum TaxID=536 RepID=A0AAX2M8W9_CHRVL|nr:hypothetical protein [Chromobacterium violaceum]STB70796.1 Uncharacterised protein [Chromobacterium violaceum]SUX32927.1 Uncharacterised protein [Chromobacterium violaceum]
MDKNLAVSISIGAHAASALAAFGNVKQSLAGIGQATSMLKAKQNELGSAIQRQMGTLAPKTLAAMNHDYEKLGRTIDSLRLKQEKLAASMARGEMLKDRRQEHWSGLRESAATAAAVALPVGKSVQLSASYQDAIKDIAITGDLAPAAEAALGQSVRTAALRFNQSQFEMALLHKS